MLQQLGRYRITGKLGAGGMGVVYLAEDTVLGRRVALKTVRLLEGADPNSLHDLAERFLREARIVAQMDHAGIVGVYDFGYEGETAYLVLEYVAGSNLANRLEQPPRLDRVACARVLREAASALDYAHKRGVVHRDVKPANLLLTDDGRVKVADFGIAKLSGSTTMTAAGMLMGTVEYMSPEQIRGETVDGRSDQYSLAVVAYQLVTGQRPFQADSTITLAHMIVYEQPTPASAANQVPPVTLNVDRVLARALDKRPTARYATCSDFVQDLEVAWIRVAPPVENTGAPTISAASVETAPMEMPAARSTPPNPTPSVPVPAQAQVPPPLPGTAMPQVATAGSKKWIWVAAGVFLVVAGVAVVAAVKFAPIILRSMVPSSNSEASSQPAGTPQKTASQTSPAVTPQQAAQTGTASPQALPPRTPPSSLPVRRQASPEEQKAERDEATSASAKSAGAQLPASTLEKKAAAGDIRTMVQTGDAFVAGRGGAQDYARARHWYEKAAAKGDGGAMSRIGDLYLKGLGVPRDYVMARSFYEQAAAKDFREAMDRLGELYYQGLGVPKDYGAARKWYEKSAQRDFPLAFIHLARLYRYGNGVAQDCDVARNWYEEAAGANNNSAMLMLGDLYAEGCIGFRDDREKARDWYTKAADAGNEAAREKLHALK
ncbi:MAG TPA: protein kinase [Bryobacteraceae bacterium]|nr:protein kinase [Bryobacteraceae bacterium]